MPFWEGLKKAPDLHLNHIIDLKVYDMYFVFKSRITSIYVFYKTVQYQLCNHHKFIGKMGFGLFGLGCGNKTPLLIKKSSVIVKVSIAQ